MKGIRRLACLTAGFSAGVFSAHYLIDGESLYMAALVCLAASLIGFLFKGNTRKRILLLLVPAAFGLCY